MRINSFEIHVMDRGGSKTVCATEGAPALLCKFFREDEFLGEITVGGQPAYLDEKMLEMATHMVVTLKKVGG